jgi:hypothetical protein
MATKTQVLKPSQVEKLKKFGIKESKDYEKAKEALIKMLEKEQIDREVIEDENVDTLLDMLSELKDISVEEDEEEVEEEDVEENDEEEDYDELAEEVEEESSEDEDEEEEEESLEEDEEESVKPIKKGKVSTVASKTSKPTTKPSLVSKVVKPTAKPAAVSSDSNRFDARNNKKHLSYLEPFKEFFPEKEYSFDILKNGFTIRRSLKNNRPTILNFDELKIIDGELFGNFYANRFKNPEELVTVIGEDYEDREIGMFRGESHPCIRKVAQAELLAILSDTDFIEVSLKKAGEMDDKLGKSRVKLEESLKESKSPAKKSIKQTNKK